MSWNGSGTFELTDGTANKVPTICSTWASVGDATILASEMDDVLVEISDGIHACLTKNGETTMTGNQNVGGYRLTNLGAPTASTDAGRHGSQVVSGAYSSPNIVFTKNDGTTFNVDVSGIEAGTSGVDLTTAQTISGTKTFNAEQKFGATTKHEVAALTPGASVTVDTTSQNSHFTTVSVDTTVTFTLPTDASDSTLGDNWCVKGEVTFVHSVASKTITISTTPFTTWATQYSIEGTHATGAGDISTLTYNLKRIGSNTYAQLAWVSTP